MLAERLDAFEIDFHVRLALGVVDLAADGAHQLAQALNVLRRRRRARALPLEQLEDALVHDTLRQHLLLVQVADELDVAQHALARRQVGQIDLLLLHLTLHLLAHRDLALLLLLLLGILLLLRLTLLLLVVCLVLLYLLCHRHHCCRTAFKLLLALVEQHAPEGDLAIALRARELGQLVLNKLAQPRVELTEGSLRESFVEDLVNQVHHRLRLQHLHLQNLTRNALEVVRRELVQHRLVYLLPLLLLRVLAERDTNLVGVIRLVQLRHRAAHDVRRHWRAVAPVAATTAAVPSAIHARRRPWGQRAVSPAVFHAALHGTGWARRTAPGATARGHRAHARVAHSRVSHLVP
mmetsp:Transcript_29269/g.75118  ORF Transcript_29269/g.75118 Transcript_29269/m.75118 type:complete len:350 (-) Transcript_29269:2205-3254(-)